MQHSAHSGAQAQPCCRLAVSKMSPRLAGTEGYRWDCGGLPADSKCPDLLAIQRKACAVAGLGHPSSTGSNPVSPTIQRARNPWRNPRFRALRFSRVQKVSSKLAASGASGASVVGASNTLLPRRMWPYRCPVGVFEKDGKPFRPTARPCRCIRGGVEEVPHSGRRTPAWPQG